MRAERALPVARAPTLLSEIASQIRDYRWEGEFDIGTYSSRTIPKWRLRRGLSQDVS